MGFASVQDAERKIKDGLAQGPIGDEDISFVNVVTRGMSVTDSVIAMVHQATDNLENRGTVKVTRSASGCPQIVELCADQIVTESPPPALPVVKRSLSKFELLKEMHDVLKVMSDDNGVVHSNKDHGDFVKSLHRKLSADDFVVDTVDVITVFDAMTTLGLRGNSRSLRGVGMWVLQESLIDIVSDGDSRFEALREYAERNRLDLEQTSEQLIAARAEIAQLTATLADVQGRHTRATEQILSMRTELERVTTSRDQLRRNNDDLKVLPANIVKVIQEMIGSAEE